MILFVPCDHVFPAGTESSSILSKFHRCPGVERGRRAEERLQQWDATGPGGLPAQHGAAAGHPGWPVRGVQPGVGRSGVKTEVLMVSLPVEADRGGRTAAGCCCQVPSRASCVQKSAIVSCATSRCFQGLLETYASLKTVFWSAFKSPQRCSKPRGVPLLQCRVKQQFIVKFDSVAYFVTAVHVLYEITKKYLFRIVNFH